jgi:hypothetical protein
MVFLVRIFGLFALLQTTRKSMDQLDIIYLIFDDSPRRMVMKKVFTSFSVILICGLILAACSPKPQPQPQPQQPQATEPPAAAPTAEAPTAEPASPAPAPTTAPAPAVQHTDVPGDLPAKGGLHLGDNTVTAQPDQQRAFSGDGFIDGRLERPFNADAMDVYSPFLDITGGTFFISDSTWVYADVNLAGLDSNNALSGKYGVELDLNQDGRGEFLILISSPASKDWTTDGVQVFKDSNQDIGGSHAFVSDSGGATGDGYETLVFDQGKGDDPDTAWVRVSPTDPKSFQVAFKKALIGDEKTYGASLWAGADLNPALFDYVDHFTHDQAGAALKSSLFYPIKALFNIDNTCRAAIGFTPTGNQPGVCSGK